MRLKHAVTGFHIKIKYVGGPIPYLWIGDGDDALATVESVRELRQLKRFCELAIAKLIAAALDDPA